MPRNAFLCIPTILYTNFSMSRPERDPFLESSEFFITERLDLKWAAKQLGITSQDANMQEETRDYNAVQEETIPAAHSSSPRRTRRRLASVDRPLTSNSPYVDRGCEIASQCTICPAPGCKYDLSKKSWEAFMVHYATITTLYFSGNTAEKIAEILAIDTVFVAYFIAQFLTQE